ncbi:MAG: inositol monophosphatase [Chloroflexi bacterium]|nr:inositol monophosphatase [Chloroflexota bacterium]
MLIREKEVAVNLAREAGMLLQRWWVQADLDVSQKGVINPVTEVDRQAEELITRGLAKGFPKYGILAEEGTDWLSASHTRWIVDPLDGTTNFIKRYPFVAVSIGLEMDGELILGVVFNPILDEMFVGECGQGATLNDRALHVSQTGDLGQAVIASGFPYDAWTSAEDNTREWAAMVKRVSSLRCDGSAALDLCGVACGRLDAYWERGVYPWDIAAGAVIVREAGGMVSDYRGGGDFLQRGEVVAANPVLSEKIREIIAR